jgi:hypothetical protein
MIKRRDLITLLCGTAAAWPLTARAQQGDRVWRIGVLMSGDGNDTEGKRRYSAFTQALAGLGWTDGRNRFSTARLLRPGRLVQTAGRDLSPHPKQGNGALTGPRSTMQGDGSHSQRRYSRLP